MGVEEAGCRGEEGEARDDNSLHHLEEGFKEDDYYEEGRCVVGCIAGLSRTSPLAFLRE